MTKIAFYLFISTASIVLMSSCSKLVESHESVKFPVIEVMLKDTMVYKDYVADINAVRNIELRARVQGYLDKILIDEGQKVKTGQVLFQINDEEYKAGLAEAKANLSSILAEATAHQLEEDRVKMLVEKDIVSKTELMLATSRLAAAKARIEEAQSLLSKASIRLSQTSVRAPFDGQISRLPFKMGSLIDEGSLLTTVSDVQYVYAYFKVSESEYLRYMKNLKSGDDQISQVSLVLADGTMHIPKGIIEVIEGEFEQSTGTIAFRAKFPNPTGLLKHGSSGKVRLSIRQEDAIIVPQKSTFEIQDKTFVYVVDKDNVVNMKMFVPKARLTKFYIVESGLVPGERIVYEGIQDIREGMKIEPEKMSTAYLLEPKMTAMKVVAEK